MINDAAGHMATLANAAGLGTVVDGDAAPVVPIKPSLAETAILLAPIISRLDLYQMSGDLVYFDHAGERQLMSPVRFRNWINHQGVITCRKFDKNSPNPIPETMHKDEAATLLVDCAFLRGVRPLKGVNHVRCPVVRPDGSLEALPWGYDAQTQIYTVPGGMEFEFDLPLEAAKGRILRLLKSFPITDDRSFAVQVAAMLALFIRHLPGGTGLRPGFLWYANKPGSGKSVLAKVCLYIVMGRAAVAKLKKDDDLDKEIEAFCRAAVPYIFLDNIRGGLNSTTIEQMLTSEESTGRAMGGHGTFDAKNTALLLATGNQIDLTEDALRRFLLIDLFEKGDPEARQVDVPLNDTLMRSEKWRIEMLEALWALVRNWHERGMPKGSKSLASFEEYAALLGGIVEAAGYEPPFQKAEIADAKSPGAAEFDELLGLLLEEMEEETEKEVTMEVLARLARAGQLYQKAVGTQAEGKKLTIKLDGIPAAERAMAPDMGYLDQSMKSAFGKLMTKQIGTEHMVKGKKIEFGKREQARKATYTVKLLA
jgi:hypothetical protein